MSETGHENEFPPRMREAIDALAAEECRIAPPARLRQRVIDDFQRRLVGTADHCSARRRESVWTVLRPWNWSIQRWAVFASFAILLVASLASTIELMRVDWPNWPGAGPHSPTARIPVDSATTAGVPTTEEAEVADVLDGGSERRAPARSDLPADHWPGEEDAVLDPDRFFDDLSGDTDFEYLIYVEVPADHWILPGALEASDVVEGGEGRVARLALGDDGMVRAVHLPFVSAPPAVPR